MSSTITAVDEASIPAAAGGPARHRAAWTLLAAVLCFAALAAPFFLGRVYVADDLGEFHLPVRNFYAEQLAHGEPFDWLPSLYGGFYISGEGQLGAYHPWHRLLYGWLPLGAAFDLELLASYPVLFAGMFVFLRRWRLDVHAALFGALVFTFGGFCLLHFVHPNAIAVVAHLPWLLWTADVALFDTGQWRRIGAALLFGLLVASQLLLGYPQYVWLCGLMVAAYGVWRLIGSRPPWARVAWLLTFAVSGVLAASVQLLPTYDLLADSLRRQADAEFSNTGSLHPLNLMQLVAPYLFKTRVVGQNTHELGLYLGAAPALLCLWLLAQRKRWGGLSTLIWAALAFGAFALLMALGEFGPIYHVQQWLPVVDRFRFPCRAIVLVQASMAVLAAAAMMILTAKSRSDEPREGSSRVLAVGVLASVVVAIAGPMLWGEFTSDAIMVWTGPLLVAAAACLIVLAERQMRGAVVALVLLTAADLAVYGLSYSVNGRTADLHEFVAKIPRPPGRGRWRIVVPDSEDGLRSGDRPLLVGLSRIDGYAGLEPARELDYGSPKTWQLAGVGWALRAADDDSTARFAWTRIPAAAPRARLVPWAEAGSEPFTQRGAKVLLDEAGHLAIETDSPTSSVLATTESFHRGWLATVDGQPATVVRVSRDFLGCEVPAGQHRVELVFRPQSLRLGKWLTTCGLGLMVCAVTARAWSVVFRRRRATKLAGDGG